jgi:hypothetical protein
LERWLKLDEKLKIKVLFEISQIDKLLDSHKPLLDLCKIKPPDLIEMSASAMFLHSFYNGIENILKLIIKFYDSKLPNDIKWHMELLEKAFVSNESRREIFKKEIQEKMEEYLKFRHFVRHSYGFQLEWERMEDLICDIENFWEILKNHLKIFMENN